VFLLNATEQAVQVVRLGAEPPEFIHGPVTGDIWVVHLKLWRLGCHQPVGARNAAAMALSAVLEHEPWSARRERIEKAQHENNPERLLELCRALELCGDRAAAGALGAWALQQHPNHAELRVAHGCRLASTQAWDQVRDVLATTDPTGLDEDRA